MSKKPNIAAEAIETYGTRYASNETLFTCLGIPKDAVQDLLIKAESLAGIAKMTLREISAIKGIGRAKAATIVAAIEIGRRRQAESKDLFRTQMATSLDAFELIHPHMRDLTQEEFWIILLDRRSKLIRHECIHRGGMSAMVVDPKIIFQKALEYKASCVILAHNHPSGAPSPSIEDIRLTEKVKMAGGYIDIKVLDHIVIGDGTYYSFADEGKM